MSMYKISYKNIKIETNAISFKEALKNFYEHLGKKPFFKKYNCSAIQATIKTKSGRYVIKKKFWIWLDGEIIEMKNF